MTNLLNYKTPPQFDALYTQSAIEDNLKNVRILGIIFFGIALIVRLLAITSIEDKSTFFNYEVYSSINWVQLFTTPVFALGAHILLKYQHTPLGLKRIWAILLALFLLFITMLVSYHISLYNTKNTVTLFLIGIITVSLFFNFKLYEILFISITITLIYWTLIWTGPISKNEKIMNIFAGIIFGNILFLFSRYCYFFKSQQFVRLKLLQIKNSEIESLHQQRGEILSFVAHDLRAPLSNIEALANLIQHQNTGNNPHAEEVDHIIKSTQLAKSIINDLIEVIKTKPGELERKDLNLHQFLNAFVNKWRTLAKREINLVGLKPNTSIVANANKLERVLDNLISNAIKFSEENQEITVRCAYGPNTIKIQIIDHGIGIPSNMLEHIFSQFTTAGRTGLKGEKSIGLGLHIAKRIMEQHYGDLSVESEEHKGTIFTMLLPA
ncbi:MAG: HAMP domain-containing histidine kinase [Pedobacter sp.]|nr:MAG: HAMP domain-containing histidine kinase [Pedobacter sp.]